LAGGLHARENSEEVEKIPAKTIGEDVENLGEDGFDVLRLLFADRRFEGPEEVDAPRRAKEGFARREIYKMAGRIGDQEKITVVVEGVEGNTRLRDTRDNGPAVDEFDHPVIAKEKVAREFLARDSRMIMETLPWN
jgi:hypothetical protein